MVRDVRLGRRYRRAVLRRALASASQAAGNPGLKVRAPCQSLAADRFEASRCLAPVTGGRQPRPRSHDHGHAVHPFTALPPTTCPRPGQHTDSAGHMALAFRGTFRDRSRSWLTRAEPSLCALCVRWPDSISATRTGNSAFVVFAGCATRSGRVCAVGENYRAEGCGRSMESFSSSRGTAPCPGLLRGLFWRGHWGSDRLSPPI
jgi:hypothetical protein